MNSLELVGLHKAYPGSPPVLEGVDLSIAAGSILGLLGLNGSGKTTSLRILMGLTAKDRGEILLSGERINPTHAEHKKRFGAVLDEPLYFDWLSPRDYLVLSGRLRGMDRRTAAMRTDDLLGFFDLADVRHQPIRTFSTGMKKKVSLAGAIMHRPDVLVLDEPFEGIDPVAARDIRHTLQFMASRGAIVLVTSHILDAVERLCTDIAVLHEGRIVLRCPAGKLRDMALHRTETAGGHLERVFFELVSPERRKSPPSFLS